MGFSGDVVNFAVIGAGRVGRVHACDIAARPRARRRTIVDPQAPDLHDLAAQYRVGTGGGAGRGAGHRRTRDAGLLTGARLS